MIKAIKTKQQYNKAVKRIYELMQEELKQNSAELNELDVLSILVEKYEEDNFPIELPDPIEAIRFRMEQLGLTAKDMTQYMGYSSRVSEIFKRKRALTLDMINRLHNELNIPAEVLLKRTVNKAGAKNL
jgi:HTH-type transcriptional regulator/antitoxin HigA